MGCAGHVRLSSEGIIIAKVEKAVATRSITELDHVSNWLRLKEFSRVSVSLALLHRVDVRNAVFVVEVARTWRVLELTVASANNVRASVCCPACFLAWEPAQEYTIIRCLQRAVLLKVRARTNLWRESLRCLSGAMPV